MKKTILFAMMAAVLGLISCSKEEPVQSETTQKGMILRATVEQPADTKATFTDNEGVWHFDFAKGDVIKVTNKELGYDKYYTFTYDGEKFVSEDAKPASKDVTWYAFSPSNSVPLAGQSGTWEDVANKYIMKGSTSTMVTGADGLNITMRPKVAVLKINSLKPHLDINVKMSKEDWVSYYNTLNLGKPDTDYILHSEQTKQTLLNTTETGTYYVAVPAAVQLVIKDGDEVLKSTGTSGLQAGKYYEITIEAPLAIGTFSVSATQKVRFSKGNLYWDGDSFEFETNQYDSWNGSWNASHISYFYWSKSREEAYASSYLSPTVSGSDIFFTNSTAETANPNFTINGVTGKFRTLSVAEWQYLFNTRTVNEGTGMDKSYSLNIKYGKILGLVLYPDDYSGEPISGTVTELPEGVVFLPAAGYRQELDFYKVNDTGYYLTSQGAYSCTLCVSFSNTTANTNGYIYSWQGGSVRLVTDVK